MFLFAFAAALATAGLFGVVPAWQSAGVELGSAMREGSHTVAGGRRWFLRLVVVGEIALALALLISAGLVIRSYRTLSGVDLGFSTTGAVAFQVPRVAGGAATSFYDDLLLRLGDTPGIRSAAVTQALPLRASGMGGGFMIQGRSGAEESILANWRIVSRDYFTTLGIPLREGRAFGPGDRAGSERVAVVTESFARRAWPDGHALGRRISWGGPEPLMTVVGVVGDIRLSPAAQPTPHVYMPFQQVPERAPQDLIVRADAPAAATIDLVRRTIWSIDRNQPVAGITTMDQLVGRSLNRRRFQLTLFTLFAGVAAALALVGIYGVLSYVVSQMSAELGLRIALGATRAGIVWQVLRLGLVMTTAGIVAGTVLALWSSRLLGGFLFGITARDPLTYAAIALALVAAASIACLVPAGRAARVDPVNSLRGYN